MDPNETLARMLRAANEIEDTTDEIERSMLADELACLVMALDGWIKAGGFLPAAWVPKRDTEPCPPSCVPNAALIEAARHGRALAEDE